MTTAVWVSIVALIFSLASLGWQAWTWARAGPVLRIRPRRVLVRGEDGRLYVPIMVMNKGRAAATIDAWGYRQRPFWWTPRREGMLDYPPPGESDSPPMPVRLEPHSSVRILADYQDVHRWCYAHKFLDGQMRAWVRTGGGKHVFARERGVTGSEL